jgi:acyl-coenzyme A synthetase/AMP-(fatty) acid ligase/3-hydroxymyristoyl/3-hydroxydecanoyl-(acyl carrier protein) dehydratase
MANTLALEHLLAHGRAPQQGVAERDGVLICYREFVRDVAKWRSAFATQPGLRWGLYFHDSYQFAAALLGAWHAGKCVYLPADLLPHTIERLQQRVDGMAGDVPAASACLSPVAELEQGWTGNFAPLDASLEHLVVYTSGSTGEPSESVKRLSQMFCEVATLASCWGADFEDAVVLGSVSHQHIYGLLFRILLPLATGAVFHTRQLGYPEEIAKAMSSNRAAVLIASPAQLRRLPESIDWSTARQQLRQVFSSGGPLPDSALDDCRRLLGQAPVEIYGSSETGGVAWRQRTHDHALHWRTLPGIEIRAPEGVLQVRSKHLRTGDWFTTDDLVLLDDHGFLLRGRADRIEKIEEKRVSLTAMERAAQATGLCDEVRIVRLADDHHPLGVVVVPNQAGWTLYDEQGRRALNTSLRQALSQVVEASVLPRRFRYVSQLPGNAQGKVELNLLLALFDPRRPPMRLLTRDRDSARLQIEVLAALPFFDGHFPDVAVLPGVAMLEWASLFGRELFSLPATLLRMEAIKFRQLVLPDTVIVMELKLKNTGQNTAIGFTFTSDAGVHSSGQLVFTAQ